jgi:hypothetical protein
MGLNKTESNEGLSFTDFYWLIEKDKPHGLKPITPDDMGMAMRDTEVEEEPQRLQDFETWTGKKNTNLGGSELEPITDLHIAIRDEEQ